jgi:tetratricopeptide (TPR) repeat protein
MSVKTIFGFNASGSAAFVMFSLGAMVPAGSLLAQQPVAPASISGHVINAAAMPVVKGDVKLTPDIAKDPKDRKYPYSYPLDAKGNYKGTAEVKPGDYLAVVFADDKSIDFQQITLKPGDALVVNFDMTRKEFIDKMTPDEKAALEEYKKKNAEIMAANSKIENLNQSLMSARADTKAGNFDAAIATMRTAVQQRPEEAVLWVTLGDAQLGAANAALTAARAAHTPTNDPAILQKYTDSADSYKKGIAANAASKAPKPEIASAAYNQLGQATAKSGDTPGAVEAYEDAAKAAPANASMYYFNESATLFNAGSMDEAAAAADKAIAADPKRAEAYYIKGQALVTKASFDAKTSKMVAPPGCLEAYQMYLQLAPDGSHAKDVQDILAGFGQKVESVYKAPPKKK